MKKITISIVLLILLTLSATAQRKHDETIRTEDQIEDMVQNEITGILVFKEGGNIKGLDPETKKIVWTLTKDDFGTITGKDMLSDPDLENIFKEKKDLTAVSGSPYVEAYVNLNYLIINTDTGKIVYNSSKESYWIFQSDFIPETNDYLLTLKKGREMAIALLDMETGELKWTTTVDKAKINFSLKLSANTNKAKINGNTVYYLLYGNLYSFDKETGNLNWKAEEEYTKFYETQNDKNIVVVNSGGVLSNKEYLNVLSTDNGKSIWKESIKTKYVVYLEDWGTKLLIAHNSGFNFYDLNTGEKIWKKDARGDGLKRVIPIEQDFLYVAENEMMLINKDGGKLWKKFIEISDDKEDPIYYLGKVGEKVMYLTGTYGNMVDYKTGVKLWKRNINFDKNRPVLPTYDEAANAYLVYNDEKLYKFDPSISDKPEPFAKVNIQKEKELNSIELFPWGVVLCGPVEVMGVNLDGTIKYHHLYKQPGETTRRLIKSTAIVGRNVLNFSSAVKSLQGSEITMTYRDSEGEIRTSVVREENSSKMKQSKDMATASAALGLVVAKFNSRFNAMKQNRDYAYIFAKTDTGEKTLVKVSKNDGAEVDRIIFNNNNPVYEVDPATQNIFYVSDKSIQIFNKK